MQPQLKSVVMLAPLTTPTNAATGTAMLDTLGYDWCTIDVIHNIAGDTNKHTTFKISEGDTTTYASASDITALTGGTSDGNFTIPSMDNTTASTMKFNIDLSARKRYLFITIAPAQVLNTCVLANLGKGEKAPISTSTSTVAGAANMRLLVEA